MQLAASWSCFVLMTSALAWQGAQSKTTPAGHPASGIVFVAIGEPGNPADTSGLGAVAYPFDLTRTEITNAQYAAFLNAVAQDDPNGLYSDLMTTSDRLGITRSGAPGSFVYAVKPDFADKPVGGVTWYDAARYCNWLHNERPTGSQGPSTTEAGAYDMSLEGAAIARLPGARFFLPTHDEWYKAAYYDPFDPAADAGGTVDYWLYPTRSDSSPALALADAQGNVTNPGQNVANTDRGADWNGENGNVTTVAGCAATSAFGVYDLGGNMNEMTETLGTPIPPNPPSQPDPLPTRRLRGGDFANVSILMSSPPPFSGSLNMEADGANVGLRVAAWRPFHSLELADPHGTRPELTGRLTDDGHLELTVLDLPAGARATLLVDHRVRSARLHGEPFVALAEAFTPMRLDNTTTAVLRLPTPTEAEPGTTLVLQALVASEPGWTTSHGLVYTVP